MKSLRFTPLLLILLTLIAAPSESSAQIRLTAVDPVNDQVTIKNFGGSTVNISGYWFCHLLAYTQVSGGAVVSGSSTLASGAELVLTVASPLNNAASDLSFYSTPSFSSTSAMVDFVQWGSGGNGRESVATAKGIWTAGTFTTPSVPIYYHGDGVENEVAFWSTTAPIIARGADLVFASNPGAIANMAWNQVTGVSDSQFVATYRSTTLNSGNEIAIVGNYSNDIITSFGSAVSINPSASATGSVEKATIKLAENIVLFVYEKSSNNITTRIGTISGTGASATITLGPESQTGIRTSAFRVTAARLTDNSFVLALEDQADHAGKAIIGSYSGTGASASITLGSPVTFVAGDVSYMSVAALSETQFVIVYERDLVQDVGQAIVGTVSGTNITFGSTADYISTDVRGNVAVAIDEDTFVVAYSDEASTSPDDQGKARVGTVSGTGGSATISFGTEVTFESAGFTATDLRAAPLSGNYFSLFHLRDLTPATERRGYLQLGEVSGTNVSFNGRVEVAAEEIDHLALGNLTYNRVVMIYQYEAQTTSDTHGEDPGFARIGQYTSIPAPSSNATPTDIALTATSVNQSLGANATVGTLSTTDADSGDSHTYTLVGGTGDTNNGSFNISGTTLRATDASALAAGSFSVRIQTDDGNTSGTYAEAFTITVVDDVVPAAPSTPDLATTSDAGTSNSDNITTGTTPTITGTAEAGATVTLFDTNGTTQIGSGTATGGNWSIITSTLADGAHTITAKATDAAGNTSVASSSLSITLDNTGPVLTSTTTPSFTYGTPASLTVTASGSPVSFTAANALPAGLSMNSSGVFSGSPTAVGTTAGRIVLIGDTAGNSTGAVLTITVGTKALTITGVTAANKVYDRATTAALNTSSAALSGIAFSDDVTLNSGSAAGAFASANIGTSKAVTASGFALSGTKAANYTLSQPTGLTADITAKGLTVTGVTGVNKAYDSTTTGTLNTASHALVGVESGDTVTLDATGDAGTFADEHVGSGITVNASGLALSGASASNYTLSQPTGLTADITAIAMSITSVSASTKVYDGTTTAALVNTSAALSGTVSGDDVAINNTGAAATFASATVGTSLAVTPTGYALSGTDAGNYTLSQPTGLTADITAKGLTVTGVTASNKVYDATTTATLGGSATLVGIVGADNVSADNGSAAGAFATKTIGTGKAVTVTGFALIGSAAGNYTLTQPATSADITAAALTISGATATSKVYDATTTATLGGSPTPVGVLGSDTVTIDTSGAAATFADKNVGTSKAVTATGYALSGTDAGNYTLTQPTGLTADVTSAALTISGTTASNKVYDATTTAALGGSPTPTGVLGSDSVSIDASGAAATFADKNVGTSKAVTPTGYALAGTDAGNYTVSQPTGLTADITAAGLTTSGTTAANKVYNASTTATLDTGSAVPVGVLLSDTVTINGGAATGTFADKNVGTGKTVTIAGLALAGTDAGNYTLTQPATTADITQATLTVAGSTAANKTYDGNTTATPEFSSATLATILGSDTVTLNSSSATGTFADASVGTSKVVTVAGLALAGTDAANYALTQPTVTADITQATLTITGVTAANKTYDATTTATLDTTGATLVGIIGADTVTPIDGAAAGTFADKNIGTGKTVTVTGFTLGGTEAANYALTQPSTTANITQKAVTITGITAADKPFDNTTDATLDVTAAQLNDTISGDTVALDTTNAVGTFADENKGTDKVVAITGLALTGTDAGNYSITASTDLADITAKELTVTGVTAADKTYDDATTATVDATAGVLVGIETGDTVTLDSASVSGTFADALIGDGKTVTVAALALTGTDASNYAVVQPTTTASITAKEITLTGLTAASRVYDGTTSVVIDGSGVVLVGIQGDDTVTLDQSTATASFADKLIGTGKPVTVGGATLAGADAANYTLTFPTNLTADITAADLAVLGAAVTTKVYDGNTAATLDFSGASLSGIQAGDTVTLDSSGATGAYSSATADTGITVTVSGVAFAGTDAGNYTLTQPALTGAITKAFGAITFADLAQTYTSSALEPTITTTPSGMTIAVTYDGASTVPTEAGSYTVEATIVDTNFQGSDDDTFVIGKADQTVAITNPGTITAGLPTTLSTSATSGLDVVLSLDSGSATLSGNVLTPQSTAAITVRATQAGDNNYNSVTDTLTLTSIVKQTQTIDFGALIEKRANDGDFDLSATATSGLDVTFTLVSGPAMLSGNTVSMTGATGTVTVRADQAGDAIYDAATSVTQTFEVVQSGPLVYFGTATDGSAFALNIPEGSTTGTLFGTIPNGQFYILTFQVNADRSITALNLQLLGTPSTAAASLARSPLRARVGRGITPAPTANAVEFDFTGTLLNGQLNFEITELGVTFTGVIEPATGPTVALAGLYEASSVNASNGTTSFIVGTTGKVYVLAVTPGIITGGQGTIASTGAFNITTPQNVTVQGGVDAPSTTVSGTIILPSGEEDAFLGLSTQTLRTDRLINLSTRAYVDAANGADLVTGFVIGGTEPKRVLLRAVGPTLSAFGINNALADPRVTIFDGAGEVVTEVDNWAGNAEAAEAMALTGAFTLDAASLDAAYVTDLAPGVYTMRVVNNTEPGIALAEIYDASENPNSQYQSLVNISSRGKVIGGQGVLVGGFIVTGNSPKRVLVRGVGPGLADYGVSGVLPNPQLKVYNASEQVVATNDDWQTPQSVFTGQPTATAADITTANTTTGAFLLNEASADSALIITLSPGLYTVELGSATSDEGTALIEVYEIPDADE